MPQTAQVLASLADDRELMRRHQRGDRTARATLIERYLPLSRSLALRYRRSGEPLDDLVQIAALGLVKAVDRWEPERGLRLSSYAVPTILGELRRHFRDATWTVRPPRELMELVIAIERAREPLQMAIGRAPSVADFARDLEQPPERVTQALRAADCRRPPSLNMEVTDHAGRRSPMGDLIGGDDREYERAEARVLFEQLAADLDRRGREILHLRFHEDLLQADIAKRLGCSQMHVSRLLHSSLEAIRAAA